MKNQVKQQSSAAEGQQTDPEPGSIRMRYGLNRFRMIGLQHRVQQAIESSYATWRQRFTERGGALLDEARLNSEIIPHMIATAAQTESNDSTDLTTRLATLLRGCSNGQCGSFATFAPELANFVSLFDADFRSQQDNNQFAFSDAGLSAVA